MATPCNIAIQLDDKTIKAIYCHFDGYVKKGVGETLIKYYSDKDIVERLVNLGDISYLGKKIGDGSEHKSFDKYDRDTTLFYSRDRGDPFSDTQPATYYSVSEYLSGGDIKFRYLFDGNCWYVAIDNCLTPVINLL